MSSKYFNLLLWDLIEFLYWWFNEWSNILSLILDCVLGIKEYKQEVSKWNIIIESTKACFQKHTKHYYNYKLNVHLKKYTSTVRVMTATGNVMTTHGVINILYELPIR